jgi:hypothetical protein
MSSFPCWFPHEARLHPQGLGDILIGIPIAAPTINAEERS